MSKKFFTQFGEIFTAFIVWRVLLIVFILVGTRFLVLQRNFLGGGYANYVLNPSFWGFLNFDGEHYLSLVQRGYQPLTYFYFPVYPVAVGIIAPVLGTSIYQIAQSGLFVSAVSFLFALLGIWKLVLLDHKKSVARFCVLLLLCFPTSFYFASFYTESLFLALVVWSFYFARTNKWFWAGVLGAFATATRIVGVALVPALLIELLLQRKTGGPWWVKLVSIALVPMGIIAYMYYLKNATGDSLEFLHSVSIFGAQRSSNFVLLPQVFYRYFFRVIPNLNYSYWQGVFSVVLEVLTASVFLALSILGFFKIRLSYAVYLFAGYIIPTLSGSFSSLPRYVLVLFPGFILLSIFMVKLPRIVNLILISLMFLLLGMATSLFASGYWIS